MPTIDAAVLLVLGHPTIRIKQQKKEDREDFRKQQHRNSCTELVMTDPGRRHMVIK